MVAVERYGCHFARCWSSASPDLNVAMIRSGLATEWRAYSHGAYGAPQDEARSVARSSQGQDASNGAAIALAVGLVPGPGA